MYKKHVLHDDFLNLSDEICLLLKEGKVTEASTATRAFIALSKQLRHDQFKIEKNTQPIREEVTQSTKEG